MTDGEPLAAAARMRLALLVILLAACVDRGIYAEDPRVDRVRAFDLPVSVPEKHDLLFVIDNSPAMAQYGDLLAERVPYLVSSLWQLQVRVTDLHLGVITADTGAFRTDGLVGSPFLIDWKRADGTRSSNYTGDFREQFFRLASVGSAGPTIQRPLAAIRRVLAGPHLFHRDDANLLVVIISAHDDASETSIEEEAAFLRQFVSPGRSFNLPTFSERPAPRLDALVALVARNTIQEPLDGIYSDVLSLLSGFGCYRGGGDPCIESSPAECLFSDVLYENGIPTLERPLPHCDDDPAARPCWTIERDPNNCPSAEPLSVRVLRRDYPPDGTHVIGNCVLD